MSPTIYLITMSNKHQKKRAARALRTALLRVLLCVGY